MGKISAGNMIEEIENEDETGNKTVTGNEHDVQDRVQDEASDSGLDDNSSEDNLKCRQNESSRELKHVVR